MREITDILKISKSIKLLMRMKNVSFVLQGKTVRTFWPPQQLQEECHHGSFFPPVLFGIELGNESF